jgi:hypothetical protein
MEGTATVAVTLKRFMAIAEGSARQTELLGPFAAPPTTGPWFRPSFKFHIQKSHSNHPVTIHPRIAVAATPTDPAAPQRRAARRSRRTPAARI